MKTTVDIADGLLAEAREVARESGVTVRALIEEGLRRVISTRRGARRYRLPDCSWGSGGLTPAVRGGSWEEMRDASYRGRGS